MVRSPPPLDAVILCGEDVDCGTQSVRVPPLALAVTSYVARPAR